MNSCIKIYYDIIQLYEYLHVYITLYHMQLSALDIRGYILTYLVLYILLYLNLYSTRLQAVLAYILLKRI